MSYAMASVIILALLLCATGLLPLVIIVGKAAWKVCSSIVKGVWHALCSFFGWIGSLFGRRSRSSRKGSVDLDSVYSEAARNRERIHGGDDPYDSSLGM